MAEKTVYVDLNNIQQISFILRDQSTFTTKGSMAEIIDTIGQNGKWLFVLLSTGGVQMINLDYVMLIAPAESPGETDNERG